MKLLKLTVLSAVLLSFSFTINSCKKEEDRRRTEEFANDVIPMTAKNSVPTNPSTATGVLSVYYNKRTKILQYLFTWSGLSGNPSSFGIYGPAPEGYLAVSPAGAPAAALVAISAPAGAGPSGIYSGSVYVDGSVIKEQTLLNNLYYVRINTALTGGTNGVGEIRGQIKF